MNIVHCSGVPCKSVPTGPRFAFRRSFSTCLSAWPSPLSLSCAPINATALPTAEIAFLLGYSDVTAFHRVTYTPYKPYEKN